MKKIIRYNNPYYPFTKKNNNPFHPFFLHSLVVAQHYDTSVNIEYVIRGNSAILKCQIPSFVADFVSVISWHTDNEDETYYPESKYGKTED